MVVVRDVGLLLEAELLARGGRTAAGGSGGRRKPRRPIRSAALPDAGSPHATAVPSSSTIRVGSASRVTPSIVVGGAAPAAPSRAASTP